MCESGTLFSSRNTMFSLLSDFSIELSIKELSDWRFITFEVILSSNSFAAILSLLFLFEALASAILLIVAYLTWKNSSRLFENIPINLSLSNIGTSSLDASCSTLALKSNQLNSLFMYLDLNF